MARINIKDAEPGMILSEDAVHTNGRVLLKSGSKLSLNHIKIFKTWGVSTINIKNEAEEQLTTKKRHTPDEIKRVIQQKKKIFQHCDLKHPFINKLFRTSVKMSLEQTDEALNDLDPRKTG